MPQCPVCAERVPANARVCPHCDTRLGKSRSRNEDDDIEDYEDAPPRRSITKSKRRNSSSGIPMWVIVLIILGCVPLLCCPIGLALLLPAVQQAREAARQTQVKNNLKMIGLAQHNFHDTFHQFPPRGGENLPPGNQPQAWMTDILPLVDQSPLYNSLDLSKSWDANPVQPGFQMFLPIYLNPSLPQPQPDARLCGRSLRRQRGTRHTRRGTEASRHHRRFIQHHPGGNRRWRLQTLGRSVQSPRRGGRLRRRPQCVRFAPCGNCADADGRRLRAIDCQIDGPGCRADAGARKTGDRFPRIRRGLPAIRFAGE